MKLRRDSTKYVYRSDSKKGTNLKTTTGRPQSKISPNNINFFATEDRAQANIKPKLPNE